MVKSAAIPVVAPAAPDTAIVHTIVKPMRAGAVLVQERLDAVVGVPYTTNVGDPSVMAEPPYFTTIENAVVVTLGVVENVNVEPKLAVAKADAAAVDVTAKSAATPVVAPPESDTDIVQSTDVPKRDGLVFKHAKLDAVVGFPYTTNEGEPVFISTPPIETVTEYTLVVADGVVENVNVDPPFNVDNAVDD